MNSVMFYYYIEKGKFHWYHKGVLNSYCLGQPDGNYCAELSKSVHPKTLPQMAYYYAVIVPTALRQMKEDGNGTKTVRVGDRVKELPLDKDDIDDMLKDVCATKGKSRMSIEEASEFIERCIRWCAQYLCCVIPPADKDWMRTKENDNGQRF